MAVETLNEKTIKVEKMSVLDGVVWAFAPEYEYLSAALEGLTTLIYAMAFYLTESASWYALLVSRLGR